MRRIHRYRASAALPASLVLLSIFVMGPLAIQAQQIALNAKPAATAPPAAVSPGFQVTPEDLGDSLLIHRRYHEAIEQYKKAPSDSADVWDRMGIAYQMLSDANDAARCYKESLRLNAGNEFAWNNLATVYDSLGDFGKAEALYRKALELDPQSARIAMNLGTNLMLQNKVRQGSKMYQRALALDKNAFDEFGGPSTTSGAPLEQRGAINYSKAQRCAQAGMSDRAIEYLRQAISEGFTSPSQIAEDRSFAPLRGNPAYQKLLAEQTQQ